jgi:sugar lactone lactonase YvrE
MHLRLLRTSSLLVVCLLLPTLGCRSVDPPYGGNVTGGSGGAAGRGGSGGRGGSNVAGSGGSGGSAGTSGTGGSGGASGTGGSVSPDGSDGTVDAGDVGDVGDTGDTGDTGDVLSAEAGDLPEALPPDMPPPLPGTVTCGSTAAAITNMGGAEGVVVAPDGTLYFSQSSAANFIGRIRPGMPAERNWAPTGGQVFGITYDPRRGVLYAARRTGGAAVLKIDVNAAPQPATPQQLSPAEPAINGITLGEDDAVYYSDQANRNIYRVSAFNTFKSRVNATALPGEPNGLAFGPDRKLYVVYWTGTNQVTRLILTNGGETGREVFIANVGATNADGAAFDEMGRLWVTAANMLRRIRADGASVDMMMASNGANVEFGAGALSCNDIYVGSGSTGIRRHTVDVKGAVVPWHKHP